MCLHAVTHTIRAVYCLIHSLASPVERLTFALAMQEIPNSYLPVFSWNVYYPEQDPQKIRQLLETEEMKTFIKAKGLVAIIELFRKSYKNEDPTLASTPPNIVLGRIEFLKSFSPDFLLELIDPNVDWNALEVWDELQTTCGDRDLVAKCFGLQLGTPYSYSDQIVFLRTTKDLARTCSDAQYPEYLRTAAQQVVHTFGEAYQSGRLGANELSQLNEIAWYVKNGEIQPLSTRLAERPVPSSEEPTVRMARAAIGTFIRHALLPEHVTLESVRLNPSSLATLLPYLTGNDLLPVVLKYAVHITASQLPTILAKLPSEDDRLQVLLAFKDKMTPDDVNTFLHTAVYRLRFLLAMKAMPNSADISISTAYLFPPTAAHPGVAPRGRLLAEMDAMKALIKQETLLKVIQLFSQQDRISFLNLFSPDVLLEFIDSREDWETLLSACGYTVLVPDFFDLQGKHNYGEQIDFLLAMKKLTRTCSDAQHPEPLRTAGRQVMRAFVQAYRASSLSAEELNQLTKTAGLVTTVISSSDHNMQPLIDNLTKEPIFGKERRRRIVLGVLGAFLCAALVAASITLALVSFGVLAPLAIGAITLSVNMLIAGLATAAAPVALGLGAGATLFAYSGRKQGPALAAAEFVALEQTRQP